MIAPVHTDKPQALTQRAADARPQAAGARPAKSAKASLSVKGKAAKVAPKAKAAAPKGAAAGKAAPAKKAAAKAPVRGTKPTAKPVAKAAAKPASKAPVKPVAKSPAKPATQPAAKPAGKAPVKPVAKFPAKSSAKPVTKPAASKAVKPAGKPAAVKPAAKPAGKATVKPAPAAPTTAKPAIQPAAPLVAKPEKAAAPPSVPAAAPPAPASPEPTRKTKGRAAVAAAPVPVVPTHSPDAAKASYVSATDRTVAPPPSAAVIRKDPKLANNWKTKRPEDLTDEEVKSMPDSEYMNDVQLAFFRLKLVKLKQDIHNSAGETTEHLREDTVVVPDPADRATIEEEHALELRTRDRERKLLKKIEQSIARIDAGDYGYCDETGEAIGVGRLIARPTASLSLEAQQRRELKQKMFGD